MRLIPQVTEDLVKFNEKIFQEKIHFLRNATLRQPMQTHKKAKKMLNFLEFLIQQRRF